MAARQSALREAGWGKTGRPVKFLILTKQRHICVFGLGEAGYLLASDLYKAGAVVSAYDPAKVATPDGVMRRAHPALAVRPADLILAVTPGADAKLALLQSLEAIRSDALYADLSSSSPHLKLELANFAEKRDLDFADVALMSMVPGNGLATPSLTAGPGAERYCDLVNGLGGRAETVDGGPGAAAARKLLRSVMMKGTAAVLVEAVRAGAVYDDLEWLWSNVEVELANADGDWMRRLITGSKVHARRRKSEMEAAASMLEDADVPSSMTRAVIASLDELQAGGELPELPRPDGEPHRPSPPRSAAERASEPGHGES